MLGTEPAASSPGSVPRSRGRRSITLRIIAAETGTQLWSAAYDESLTIEQQPDLQATIARDVAAAAAPFGPVFDAELALARRSAHTLELQDCQTRYRGVSSRDGPCAVPGSVRLLPKPRQTTAGARARMGRHGDDVR